ncbi:excisionase family DNA binding protein [Williamsia muralis]|uniref:Excisionase family DNA binding protein n=1 Tax=Williamsia marianensis TaxID=85044 RepID=A0A495K0W4_WILMA|nr:helix-turn-helix domain-containing protein [Williamsia muralis]RKR94897.1 excisionase family DNA binding protein [Williamsia muralis]
MISSVQGTLLTDDDAKYLLAAIDSMVAALGRHGQAPSPRLAATTDRLRKTVAAASDSRSIASEHARNAGGEWFSDDDSPYAITSPSEAAKILGITPNGVRDLARRGALPARRSGGRWFISAAAVMERARH